MTYVIMRTYSASAADSLAALGMASAERALALDSTLGDAYAAKGYALMSNLEFRKAEGAYAVAIAREPENPNIRHWHSINLNAMGLLDSASAEEGRAEASDPLSPVFANHQGLVLTFAGRFDEAKARFERALAIDSTYAPSYASLAFARIFSGDADGAIELLTRARQVARTGPRWASVRALAFAAGDAWHEVDKIAAEARATKAAVATTTMTLALLHGDRSAALDAMEQGLTPRGGMIYEVLSPGCDPLLSPLHDEPRYTSLMARLSVRVCTKNNGWTMPRRPR